MDFLASETGSAIAAFWERRFGQVLTILYDAWSQWDSRYYVREDMNDAVYNALCDAVEMVEQIGENLPSIETNSYSRAILVAMKGCLQPFAMPLSAADSAACWQALTEQMPTFQYLLQAWSMAARFLAQNGIDLTLSPPKVSFELTAQGYLCLYQWQGLEGELTEAEGEALRARFAAWLGGNALPTATPEDYWVRITHQNPTDALTTLTEMVERFPQVARRAFREMGDRYMILKEFSKAVDCYMKSMVLGESPDSFAQAVREVQDYLLETCETKEARERLLVWLQGL